MMTKFSAKELVYFLFPGRSPIFAHNLVHTQQSENKKINNRNFLVGW